MYILNSIPFHHEMMKNEEALPKGGADEDAGFLTPVVVLIVLILSLLRSILSGIRGSEWHHPRG